MIISDNFPLNCLNVHTVRNLGGLGLVDDLGSFDDAVDLIAELTGIEGEPAVIYEKKERIDWFDYVANGFMKELLNKQTDFNLSGAFYLMR